MIARNEKYKALLCWRILSMDCIKRLMIFKHVLSCLKSNIDVTIELCRVDIVGFTRVRECVVAD